MPQLLSTDQTSHNPQISNGGGLSKGAFLKRQFVHTFSEIISVENLLLAWQEFVRGKRGKHDVQEFSVHLMDNLLMLNEDLQNRSYRHGPYKAFSLSDPKPRRIHKASVRDRVLHHAVYRVLYPFFDRLFIPDVYSCRVGKGMHKALNRLRSFAYCASQNHTCTAWVLKCDIRRFFEHVDHGVLLLLLQKRIADVNILWLLEEIIRSFSAAPGRGLPLGNLTSQLFCNIYMNELDQYVKHELKAKYYLRYGDDFMLISHDRNILVWCLERIRSFLRNRLCLELHPKKVSIKTIASGVDFLGWVRFPDHRVLRTATKRRMMRRIAEHPTEETLASYQGMLEHGNTWQLKQKIS